MKTTSLGLKKPEGTDPVDIQDFNDNSDTIDAELKKRPEKTGDASSMTVAFTEAASLAELTSNDSMKGLFGKLKLVTKNVISLARLMGTADISKIGNGTVTGAINALNGNLNRVPNFNWQTRTLYLTNGQTSNVWVPLGTTLATDKYTVLAIPITAYPQFFTLSLEKRTDGFYLYVYTTYTCGLTVEFTIMSAK